MLFIHFEAVSLRPAVLVGYLHKCCLVQSVWSFEAVKRQVLSLIVVVLATQFEWRDRLVDQQVLIGREKLNDAGTVGVCRTHDFGALRSLEVRFDHFVVRTVGKDE